ncbi:MAG: hypothetical protein IJ486_01710, partial [Firmicutes bacterium]|nr:hypothetical protein [Bacillota bacterium]
MKGTRKRLLALFLTLTMVLGMFPVSAMAAEPEETLAVTNVYYGVRVDGETLDTEVTPVKLETPVTVTNGSNAVTPQNMYLAEITEEQSLFSLTLSLNELVPFMGNIMLDPKGGGTEITYLGGNNVNTLLLDDSTTFTGFEKKAG